MKRWISVLLVMILLLSSTGIPLFAFAKETLAYEVYDLYVFVPDNKPKTLCLSWYEEEIKPDGYQIFRSDSGNKGTYRKIATTTGSSYTDTGLKNQTVYYYAVRAFENKGGKTVYGPFARHECCTRITKTYAAKLLKNAYEIYQKWITRDKLKTDYRKALVFSEKYLADHGETFNIKQTYYRVKDKTFTTKKEIKKYLKKYFIEDYVSTFVDAFYVEHNGRLYAREPAFVDGIGQVYEEFAIRDIAQKDDYSLSFSVIETWATYTGNFPIIKAYNMYRSNNRWVFTDNCWFPTKDWIERKLCS